MKIVSSILFKWTPLLCSVIMAIYFVTLLRGKSKVKKIITIDDSKEQRKLNRMRAVFLTKPLTECTRPNSLTEIIGQDRGLLALRAAICSPNPQHVIIYGEPGVGKTAAARLALENAKQIYKSPFSSQSKFIEIDATTLRFDERGVADPLIGAVHDPIYQGAGAYGSAGIPNPKMGAVSKAHGGVLFIDEIGELHPIQMNKLLKVLEDRKVFLESSYYNESDKNIPKYIHDIFKNGFPADFRLIGATTRNPSQIPAALRSRCMEIFFDSLGQEDIKKISANACKKAGIICGDNIIQLISNYAANGRDAINMIQAAVGIASLENRQNITMKDMEWVIETGEYSPRRSIKIAKESEVGIVNGLAVHGIRTGSILAIEAVASRAMDKGKLTITGIIEEEEIHSDSSNSKKRISTARGSIDNAITVIERLMNISCDNYNIHINYPGGIPVDGPSAGLAVFIAIYSAIFKKVVSNEIAITGEISIHGKVCPVGGVYTKILAAKAAGIKRVIIPIGNNQDTFADLGISINTVSSVEEVIACVFAEDIDNIKQRAHSLLNA